MKRLTMIVLLLAAFATVAAWAEGADPGGRPQGPGPGGGNPPPRDTPFARDFFPPETVLRNQLALGLTAEQLEAVKKLVNETHASLLDIQVELERETELFKKTIEPAKVDEAAALAQAERMLGLEVRAKRAQLTLLVRLKNILTAEQQAKLRAQQRPPPREPDDR
jgi:Spy/CpxP family protein refolding chaperone